MRGVIHEGGDFLQILRLYIYLFIYAARTEPLELWQGSGILEAPSRPMLAIVIARSFYEETEEEAETADEAKNREKKQKQRQKQKQKRKKQEPREQK